MEPQIIRVSMPEGDIKRLNVTNFLKRDNTTMPEDKFKFSNDNCTRAITPTGVDGIALSCDGEDLYYTALSGRQMYTIETIFFEEDPDDVNLWVQEAGKKTSASDGLSYGSDYYVYMTMVEENKVVRVHHETLKAAKKNIVENVETIAENIKWPDTIGWSQKGLYVVSNNLCAFLGGTMDFKNTNNFQITFVPLDATSYVYGCQVRSRRFAWPEIMFVVVGVSLFLSMLLCVVPLSCIWKYRYAFFKTRQPLASKEEEEEENYDVPIY
eukprot:CAMPEP_0117428028 /NCGR_PEP_ID=MMETSP0758-20121206/7808_1 /TAXON_ID=63605 /ORGANISM="Percolomonas cosmopolitus, Strain AE-1 (ATCC 50343)" /LENGTH=267 /DNA_ID=CAMNT_0005214119 /DNA_START=601 /DNA_END=1404 /DNA_ORIENTATION=-